MTKTIDWPNSINGTGTFQKKDAALGRTSIR